MKQIPHYDVQFSFKSMPYFSAYDLKENLYLLPEKPPQSC